MGRTAQLPGCKALRIRESETGCDRESGAREAEGAGSGARGVVEWSGAMARKERMDEKKSTTGLFPVL